MKRTARLSCLVLTLLLAGCGTSAVPAAQEGQSEAQVYFLGPTPVGSAVRPFVTESRSITADSMTEILEELIACMYYPRDVGNRPLLPPQVKLRSVTCAGSVAVVDFSSEYQRLSPLEKSLAAAGTAMTLLAQEGINYVRITAAGAFQPPMGEKYYSEDRILMNSQAIAANAFDVVLYFISENGEGISPVQRTIKTEEEYPSPYALLMELLNPPEGDGLIAPLMKEEDVNFCQMEQDVCHIDLSSLQSGQAGQLQIHAMVNTVAGDNSVETVVVTVGGKPPSSVGVEGCDGEMTFSADYIQ